MEGNGMRSSGEPLRWESALEPLLAAPSGGLWRAHSDAVNAALVARWLPWQDGANVLKTDLFDEAMGDGLFPLLSTRAARVAALDIAPSVLAASRTSRDIADRPAAITTIEKPAQIQM